MSIIYRLQGVEFEWDEEIEKIEQLIDASIDWRDEEIQFLEKLHGVLYKAPTKKLFLEKANRMVEEHPNPWLRDDLAEFVDALNGAERILG